MQDNHVNKDKPWKKPPGGNRGLTQAYEIRDFAADLIMKLRDERPESLADKAAIARATKDSATVWQTACDRIRIIRNKPLPGSLKPEPKPTKKKPSLGFPTE